MSTVCQMCRSFGRLNRSCYSFRLLILGQIMALSNFSEITYNKNKKSIQRQKKYTKYFHYGQQVCPVTFHFLHIIVRKLLKNLTHHFKENELIPRVHGNTKRPPKHALSFSSIEYVVQFLVNYADRSAILFPGRVPGYRNTDLKLLPSSVSKRGIWKVYKESAESASLVHLVAYTTLCRLWRSLLPSVILMKPMSDLCWTCQKNSTAIMRAANLSDTEKSSKIKAAQDHLTSVQLERSFYKALSQKRKKIELVFFKNKNYRKYTFSYTQHKNKYLHQNICSKRIQVLC